MSNKFTSKIIKRDAFGAWGKLKFRKLLAGLAYIMSAVTLAIGPAPNVFASSAWDTAISLTSTLTLQSYDGTETVNISNSLKPIIVDQCPDALTSLTNATLHTDGRWAITQITAPSGTSDHTAQVQLAWSTNTAHVTEFKSNGFGHYVEVQGEHVITLEIGNSGDFNCVWMMDPAGDAGPISLGSTNYGSGYTTAVYVSTYPFSLAGHAGSAIPGGDIDDDGLIASAEASQGTSDMKIDTDDDGLSDLVESSTYNNFYDYMFCDMTTNPYTCADPDPTEKDLYIEIDWMDDGVNTYKPTPTQLGLVETMLENKNINVHFDLGEFSGGNELPVYESDINWFETEGELDIHDFKYGGSSSDTGIPSYTLPAQFDFAYRENVWRYMIYGVSSINDLGSTVGGSAEAARDDVIIASENNNFFGSEVYGTDRAKAGVLAHEIGHLLCLASAQRFPEHDPACVHSEIDTLNPDSDYRSVMNYDYALPSVYTLQTMDYSDGTHGTGDHDDWSAILGGGMGSFIYNSQSDVPSDPPSLLLDISGKSSNGIINKNNKNNKNNKTNQETGGMPALESKAQDRVKNKAKTLELSPWYDHR